MPVKITKVGQAKKENKPSSFVFNKVEPTGHKEEKKPKTTVKKVEK